MAKVKWGVLSTAGIAQKQLIPAFQRASNAEVVAIASSSGQEKARQVANQFNIDKAYGSYEALLEDASIDAVYIPLPNHLHKKWVMEAATKGKHILCEKPAALNTEEVREMKEVCEAHQVLFMEGFMYYFHPQHERVKEIIASGEIGEVKAMHAAFSFYLAEREHNIRMDAQKGGGSIYDIGCYAIHSIRNVLQSEPKSVHVYAKKDPVYQVDTDVHGYLKFEDGLRASFDSSFDIAKQQAYEVYGTKGIIKVPRAYRPDENGGDGLVIVESNAVTRTETVTGDQYRNEVEHISEAIQSGNTHLKHDFTHTIHNMRTIDACYSSIKTGDLVPLS